MALLRRRRKPFELVWPNKTNGDSIPKIYSCLNSKGTTDFPPLKIRNVPPEAKSLLFLIVDYDAKSGGFCHFARFNIDPNTTNLDLDTGTSALNDGNTTSLYPFCPPAGETHQYYFRLIALDRKLKFAEAISWTTIRDYLMPKEEAAVNVLKEAYLVFKFHNDTPVSASFEKTKTD